MIAGNVTTSPIDALQALSPYASRLLIDLVRGDARHDERFEGAILFLDIVGSTSLASQYASAGPDGAERLGDLLNRHFQLVFRIIGERHGDVIAMEGDSVLALWRPAPGLPGAVAEAAAAALALEAAFRGGPLSQRIVVASGTLTPIVLNFRAGRRLLLLAGEPVRGLGPASAACPPGGVALPHGVAPLLGRPQTKSPAAPGMDALIAPFLPRPLVERIVAGEGASPPEFRDLTAIMILLDTLDASALVAAAQAVDAAFEGVGIGVAEASEGDKGVSLRVAVGAPPYVLDDNAVGGVEAARRALEALQALGVAAGVGVATGRAFALEVGEAQRRVPTLLGPVMNRAARLMEAARGEVLVCEATAAATAEHFEFDAPQTISLKGERAPTTLRRLAGRRASRPKGVAGEGLFGRDKEAERLAAFYDIADAGSGLIAVIEGEPGAGKSRLLAHAEALARGRGGPTLVVAAQSIEQETSYFAFRQILFDLISGDPKAPLEQGLAARLDGDPIWGRTEPLTDLLPLDPAALGGGERLTGAARRMAIADVLTRLLQLAGPKTSLLIDDAHWLDRSSAWLLTMLAPRLPGLIVTLATRPLYEDASTELKAVMRAAALHIEIGRLDRTAIDSLVHAKLAGAAAPARFVDYVFARSEGLPLHAEQLVLAMLDQGLVVRAPNGRILEVDLESHVDVVTLRDVILRRVDLLAPRLQALMKAASVLGRDFDPALLPGLDPEGSDAGRLRDELARLIEAGLMEPGPKGYAFRHVRIQEAVYDLLPFAQRRALHRAAALAIEQAQGEDRSAVYAELAAHWENAGEPARGAAYRLKVAARALDTFAHHETIAQLRAIERAGGHDTLLQNRSDQVEFARMFGRAAEEISDFEAARPWLLRCAELAGVPVRGGFPALLAGTLRESAVQLLLRARLIGPRRPGPAAKLDALSAELHNRLAEQAYHAGDPFALLHATLVALNSGERGRNGRDLGVATGAIAIGLGFAGQFRLARFYQRRALAVTASLEPWDVGIAHMQSAVTAVDLGDWPLALAMASSGSSLFAGIGEQDRFGTCQSLLAYALIATGESSRAEQGLLQFGEFAEKIDQPRVSGWLKTARALIDLMKGRSAARALERLNAVGSEHLATGEIPLPTGLKAAALLMLGEREPAIEFAESGIDALRRSRPISLAYFGAGAATAVCLALAERDPSDLAARRRAEAAIGQMIRISGKVRVWQGLGLWLAGRAAVLDGRPARAAAFWRRGLAAAERLGQPFEAALCRRELGDHKSANVALDRMGSVPWLDFGMETKK